MSIKKYTNIDAINNKTDNQGQYLESDDLFIVSKTEIEETDFGDCKYDVMEVSVYDVNNNLLPHKSGNNIAYIKTGDIKNYLYNLTNKGGQKELAIDIEKLLNDLGFTNGILKVNLNFVRYKIGTENESTRVWIHEISPSREEIRILPLKTKDTKINEQTTKEFNNLGDLRKDFKYYKKSILNSINSFEGNFLDTINSTLETKYGKDFFNVLRKDFGLSKFDDIRKRIYEDFKLSVTYYLTNKYYEISDSTFGKPSEIRFIDCDQYDFQMLTDTIKNILYGCISYNLRSLKRRNVDIKQLPKEFAVTELRKEIKNTLDSFTTPSTIKRNVYQPDKVDIKLNDNVGETPILPPPPVEVIKIMDPAPIEIVVVPPPVEVIVEPTYPTFEYTLKDTSPFNGVSVVKFIDAAGNEVEKTIPFGKEIIICARENSISNNNKSFSNSNWFGSLFNKANNLQSNNLKIIKGNPCNSIDISREAPIQQTGGGGGGGLGGQFDTQSLDYNNSKTFGIAPDERAMR